MNGENKFLLLPIMESIVFPSIPYRKFPVFRKPSDVIGKYINKATAIAASSSSSIVAEKIVDGDAPKYHRL
jgi:hypothetical protein